MMPEGRPCVVVYFDNDDIRVVRKCKDVVIPISARGRFLKGGARDYRYVKAFQYVSAPPYSYMQDNLHAKNLFIHPLYKDEITRFLNAVKKAKDGNSGS